MGKTPSTVPEPDDLPPPPPAPDPATLGPEGAPVEVTPLPEGYRSALDDPAHPLHHLRNA